MAEPENVIRLHDHACADCRRLQKEIDGLTMDLRSAEQETKRLRRQLREAKEFQDTSRKRHPNYEMAEKLFDYWKEQCGHPGSKFGARRAKAVLARLEDYPPKEIAKAILGAAAGAYVDDKGVRHDDLELICRDEVKLEKFIARYEAQKGRA